MEEPVVKASIITPTDYTGAVMELCQDRRGKFIDMQYLEETRVVIHYEIPLNEIVYDVPIQAAVGSKIIARETVKAMRKDVLAKCYGGDISRKKKLLEKQKEGKKRMRQLGTVEVPQEAFMSVLKVD